MLNEIDDSDSYSHSLTDDNSFHADESVQDTQEEATALTGSSYTRIDRREAKKQCYLQGNPRKPYHMSKELQRSFEDSDSACNPLSSGNSMACHVEQSQWNKNVCKSCTLVLKKYAITLKV